MTDDRLLAAVRQPEDADAALRPKSLDDFVGHFEVAVFSEGRVC